VLIVTSFYIAKSEIKICNIDTKFKFGILKKMELNGEKSRKLNHHQLSTICSILENSPQENKGLES